MQFWSLKTLRRRLASGYPHEQIGFSQSEFHRRGAKPPFSPFIPDGKTATLLILGSLEKEEKFYNGTFDASAENVPILAITDIYKNLLYVYIVMIIFYFSSGAIDRLNEESKMKTQIIFNQNCSDYPAEDTVCLIIWTLKYCTSAG